MEDMVGLLRIHVVRGINLAIRDFKSSDPYIIVRMGKQKLKTRVIKKNINPEWNEELTLSTSDPKTPVKLKVYDKDRFTQDDKMGDAEFDIGPLIDVVQKSTQKLPNGTVITKVEPSKQNCLAEESSIMWENGKVTQHMRLRLRNVECGEVQLRLQWIDVSGSRAL